MAAGMTYWFGDTPIDAKVEDGVYYLHMKSGIDNWQPVDALSYWVYRGHGMVGPILVVVVMVWLGIKLLRRKLGR